MDGGARVSVVVAVEVQPPVPRNPHSHHMAWPGLVQALVVAVVQLDPSLLEQYLE